MDQTTKQIILDHLYNEHSCKNCKHCFTCKLEHEYSVCEKWEEAPAFGPDALLNVVRLAYPNAIKGKLFSEFPMNKTSDNIFYIKPEYTDDADKMDVVKSEPEDACESKPIKMVFHEDNESNVAKMFGKWANLVNGIEDENKKNMVEKILESQEAYLNSINTGKK